MWNFVMPEWLSNIADKVFTEAGILAFILFWMNIYQAIDARMTRKQAAKDLKEANDKIYYMGTKSVEQQIVTSAALDKNADAIETLTIVFEKSGILEKKNVRKT